jgi:hypothetical protein
MTKEEFRAIERSLSYKISLTKPSGKMMKDPKLTLDGKIKIHRVRADYIERLRAHRLSYFNLVD